MSIFYTTTVSGFPTTATPLESETVTPAMKNLLKKFCATTTTTPLKLEKLETVKPTVNLFDIFCAPLPELEEKRKIEVVVADEQEVTAISNDEVATSNRYKQRYKIVEIIFGVPSDEKSPPLFDPFYVDII